MMSAVVKKCVGRFLSPSLCAALVCTALPPHVLAHGMSHHKRHFIVAHNRTRLHTPQITKSAQLSIAVPEGSLVADALPTTINTYPIREWDGQDDTLQKFSQMSPALWGALLINGSQLETGCLQHWLHSLDAPASCGIPATPGTLALAWDRSRLTTAPDWQDFWDIARQPGRRGLHFSARTTLEIALLADGVAPENIYSTLSTPTGVEHAFHRLDLLRPYIIWWRTPDDARQIMQQRSALMTSAPLEEISLVNKKKSLASNVSTFEAQTNHRLITSLFWAIPQNVPNDKTLNLIAALKNIQNTYQDRLKTTEPSQNPLNIDDEFWKIKGPELEQRFLDWFGRNTPR
ncbi:extracellular solute-binding protein [Neokomagataea anthophila]|uniref:Extracellular solute-binding protein n=1 Tax=Neokomagataea anthophila TaxID=2826925 RepID=A0ABS5E7D8_9PROT|nr:extracellular solute-binding protein [Neokomagataea anthophila]MBR0559818.1 extracellular solute-binding protein [Neokomagataea anthophila]